MKTGIITTDTYLKHDTGQGHPERADRVTVVIDHLKKLKSKNLIWKKPKKFDPKYLEYAHDKNYLDNVKDSFPKQGLNFLDGDTIVSPTFTTPEVNISHLKPPFCKNSLIIFFCSNVS